MRLPSFAGRWVVGLACVLLATGCATPPDPRRMTFDPVPLTRPEVTQVQLDNGLSLYLLPDRSVPLIHLFTLTRTGRVYEPPDKPDTFRLAGRLMREGGAGDLDADAFDEALSFAAINMESHVGMEAGGASATALTRNFPLALERFADMLRRPRFDPERMENLKARTIDGIRTRDDHPGSIVRRAFDKALYGPEHPYGHETTVADIRRITRDDLLAFHRQYYHPNNTLLGVTGDFDPDEMVAAIEEAFGDWEEVPVTLPEPPPVPETERRVVRIVHKPVDQVSIRIGQVSLKRDDPDYYPLSIANRVLGGGAFMSRLFQDLRTREGLAYSVRSTLRGGLRDRGQFQMATRTRAEKAGEAVARMLAEVERLRTEPIPPAELTANREAALNAFVFNSVTAEQAVLRRMRQDYHDMPLDELDRIRAEILAATPETLLRAARAHLHPDRMVIVAVGDRNVLVPALAPFGEVEEVPPSDVEGEESGT